MKVALSSKGDFSKTKKFLTRMQNREYLKVLDSCGQKGVRALASATPIDTGQTSHSWSYKITKTNNSATIMWTNSEVTTSGVPVIILLSMAMELKTVVRSRSDFINPAIQPIFDEIAEAAWRVVTAS